MTKRPLGYILGFALIVAGTVWGPATAADFAHAKDLYAEGALAPATEEAAALGSADGYALAAQALLVRALFFLEGEPQLEAFYRAHDLATAGLASDPDHINAHLQAAGALGLQARIKGSGRLGRQARDHLKAILRHQPDQAEALAATGGWHGEVLHRAGRLLGKILFGASRKLVFENFDRAIMLRPDLPSFQVAYAKTLLRLHSRYRQRAIELLHQALALAPPDHLETLSQRYGQLILEALETADKKRLKALLENIPSDLFRAEFAASP